MKGLAILLATASLVSAQVAAPAPVAVQGAAVDPNSLSSSANVNGVVGSGVSSSSLSGVDASNGFSADPNLDLSGLEVSGLNLGSVDFNSQDQLLNAIELMMSQLCLGDIIQLAQLQQLSQVAELQMFLELAQVMNLVNLGFLNLFDVQSLFGSGLFSSGFNSGSFFKRSLAEHKTTITRGLETRRITVKRQSCQSGSIVPAAGGAPSAVSGLPPSAASAIPAIGTTSPDIASSTDLAAAPVAAAPVAAAPAAASLAPAAAVAPAAITNVGTTSTADEPLSDFTR